MKKLFLITTLALTLYGKAQNLIAIESGSNIFFETRLDSALSKAQNGSTIYLPGGSFSLNGTVLSKNLTIIGAGYRRDSSNATNPTVITGNLAILKAAGGSKISGIHFVNEIFVGTDSSNSDVNSFTIERCMFSITFQIFPSVNKYQNNSKNFVLNRNVITNMICNYANVSVNNNIVGKIRYLGNNSLIRNNSFLGTCEGFSTYAIEGGTGHTIENNILSSPCGNLYNYFQNSTLRNNLFASGGVTLNGIDGSGNIYYNNIGYPSCDSIFNFVPRVTPSYCLRIYNDTFDFNLKFNSIGKNTGTDGTDVGIYGGAFPWKDGGIPSNPHIQFKSIAPKTNNQNTLPVQIKVKAQDN